MRMRYWAGIAGGAFALLCAVPYVIAQSVSQLPNAVLPLTGSEFIWIDQANPAAPTGFSSRKTTINNVSSVNLNTANPTGTIGLTAVNGVQSTAMRSDAAPALSQSIAPTWTGLHNFTGGLSLNGTAHPNFPGTTNTFLRGDATFSALPAGASSLVVGSSAITGGSTGRVLYDNAGALGERAVTGNGANVATSTGALASGDCVKIDANGNLIDFGSVCASLSVADQALSGGANVTSQSLTTGNVTIDCGSRPLQFITNGGAFTITAPANDGSCMLLVTNNATAGAITFSGFSVGASTGDALTTTNASKFTISIWRINGTSGYRVAAHQ